MTSKTLNYREVLFHTTHMNRTLVQFGLDQDQRAAVWSEPMFAGAFTPEDLVPNQTDQIILELFFPYGTFVPV